MPVFSRNRNDRYTRAYEQQAAQRRTMEQAEQERGERDAEKLRAEVRAYLRDRAKREANEAAKLATMTPAELAEHYRREAELVVPQPPRPDGWGLALEAVRREDEAKEREEREKRERADGTLRRRREWEQAHAAIEQKCAADLQAENERHAAAQRRIREHSEDAQQKLGDRP